jgi:hypothetical protein
MGLRPARGDRACEMAEKPGDPRAFYVEENDDLM